MQKCGDSTRCCSSKDASGSRRQRDLRVSTSQVTQTLQWKGLRKNLQPTGKGEALTAPSTWGACCPVSQQHSSQPERTAAACCAANAAEGPSLHVLWLRLWLLRLAGRQ
jgi:hypothetical protein